MAPQSRGLRHFAACRSAALAGVCSAAGASGAASSGSSATAGASGAGGAAEDTAGAAGGRDRDDLYGGAYGGAYGDLYGGYGAYGGGLGSYKDKDYGKDIGKDPYGSGYNPKDYGYGGYGYGGYGGYGSYGLGGYGSEKEKLKEPEDDCSRLEANGVSLAEAVREAADALAGSPLADAAPEVRRLMEHFAAPGEKQRKLLLGACPQAVALAAVLRAAGLNESAKAEAAADLSELLAAAPGHRTMYQRPPQWAAPWEEPLSAAQQRAGIVLLPTGEQQFEIEVISPVDWAIHPRRRCRGRRDLGNLQATPLRKCLAMCQAHPFCKSATYWQWQPGGFGFEERCFLSSSCTGALSTADGAEQAVLFERRGGGEGATEEAQLRQAVRTPPGGAPWAPRCGHGLLVGAPPKEGGLPTLWLFGGIGVDPFTNATATSSSAGASAAESGESSPAAKGDRLSARSDAADRRGGDAASSQSGKEAATASATASAAGGRKAAKRKEPNQTSSVIEAYLSRHVELSGELPPLRSLPYGRLGDVWRSEDLGASWTMVTKAAPWGQRAFFGAAALRQGRAFLLAGGVRQPKRQADADGPAGPLDRRYMHDVWWADMPAAGAPAATAAWRKLGYAPWAARASHRVLVRSGGDAAAAEEEVLVLGGRLADGQLASDVWAGTLAPGEEVSIAWRELTAAAPWGPRADFAAAARGRELWVLGGSDQAGRALTDVWRSLDGITWEEVIQAAPWGGRIGASLVPLPVQPSPQEATPAAGATGYGPLLLFGGYAYPDAGFHPLAPNAGAAAGSGAGSGWDAAVWISRDGRHWQTVNASWTPSRMHASLVAASCGGGPGSGGSCVYTSGGLTSEGYYDNTIHRLTLPFVTPVTPAPMPSQQAPPQAGHEGKQRAADALDDGLGEASGDTLELAWLPLGIAGTAVVLLVSTLYMSGAISGTAAAGDKRAPLDFRVRGALLALTCFLVAVSVAAAFGAAALLRLTGELRELKSARPTCQLDDAAVSRLGEALGIGTAREELEQFQTLLRLASREPQLGLGYDSFGTGKKGSDLYGYRDRYYDSYYGGYGGLYGDDPLYGKAEEAEGKGSKGATARELALLPTTQSLSCRSPRCDRNATTCARDVPRSLNSPYGCCSDYMMLMLRDVTEWLDQQEIPYYITYGTLLGALREEDILPYTQDADIVVDRAYWSQLQRGLEAAEFFGGRRYFFGVDQWEEKVSRVCADWDGFAPSIIGGPDNDRLSRATEFHLDIYASDWWQITDLHLIDCVEPLGATRMPIRGINFSAPARPRACVEKLYGAEWRTPKHALSGVN